MVPYFVSMSFRCGPCKVLTPALEEMAQKSGGLFRLVKVNTDQEKSISTALEVTALPTVFGISKGRIIHMFQGMPRSENAMKNFMEGLLLGESSFDPPLTTEQKRKYEELTTKLVKVAGSSSFPFSARERLKDRVQLLLDTLVVQTGDDASMAHASAKIVRSLFSNIIQNPTEMKYRTAKLSNAVLAGKIAPYPAALGLLKSVGFTKTTSTDNSEEMTLGSDRAFVNVAPLVVARDRIEAWIERTKREAAKALRKHQDEVQRAQFHAEGRFDKSDEDEEETEADVTENLDTCVLRIRFAGKKKVYQISLAATDHLSNAIDQLPDPSGEFQITCVAKKLVVKSTDRSMIEEKTLEELGLTPSSALVIDVRKEGGEATEPESKSRLAERSQKRKKKGSHTMQSVGIYSKDDNAKAELIDGGGGVWYEHDVTDDEEEDEADETQDAEADRDEK